MERTVAKAVRPPPAALLWGLLAAGWRGEPEARHRVSAPAAGVSGQFGS